MKETKEHADVSGCFRERAYTGRLDQMCRNNHINTPPFSEIIHPIITPSSMRHTG